MIVGFPSALLFLSQITARPNFTKGHSDGGLLAQQRPRVFQLPRDPPLRAGVMAHIYVAVAQGGVLVGDFARVTDFESAGNVEALKERIKASRSRLRGVELGDMTVFGPWVAVPPKLAIWTAKLAEVDAALAVNVMLPTLIGVTGDYFLIVRITAPFPAAAAGASTIVIVSLPQ